MWTTSPLFIIGSRFSLTNCKHGHIQIGCLCNSLKWWKENGLVLAKENNFTEAEVAEYEAYIDLFEKVMK